MVHVDAHVAAAVGVVLDPGVLADGADCTVSLPSPPDEIEVPTNSEATTGALGSVKSILRSAA